MERKAFGFSLFADDFRAEIGGKISIMGVYQIDMLFQSEFPLVIPKLAILVKYFEEKGAFTDDLMIRVIGPGVETPLIEMKVTRDQIVAEPRYPADGDTEPVLIVTAPILLSPVKLEQEGFIKVRAYCGDVTTRLGRLMVRKVKPEDNIQFPS